MAAFIFTSTRGEWRRGEAAWKSSSLIFVTQIYSWCYSPPKASCCIPESEDWVGVVHAEQRSMLIIQAQSCSGVHQSDKWVFFSWIFPPSCWWFRCRVPNFCAHWNSVMLYWRTLKWSFFVRDRRSAHTCIHEKLVLTKCIIFIYCSWELGPCIYQLINALLSWKPAADPAGDQFEITVWMPVTISNAINYSYKH
jgi:hypothetical protein